MLSRGVLQTLYVLSAPLGFSAEGAALASWKLTYLLRARLPQTLVGPTSEPAYFTSKYTVFAWFRHSVREWLIVTREWPIVVREWLIVAHTDLT